MKPRAAVIVLAVLALFAKLYCALTTIGTSDAVVFFQFARYIHAHGLVAMYRATPLFNHTPLVGWFSERISCLVQDDHDLHFYTFYLRLPAIFADLFSVVALLWLREKTGRPAWWAIALFAASPVGFMVSGFHGNVDSLVALGILLAAVACVSGQPELSGLFLGLACNVKIIPILFAPAFFFYWWQRSRTVRFSLPAMLTVLAGWSVPLLSIPTVFLKDVLGYSSTWGTWGFTYGLRMSGLMGPHEIGLSGRTPGAMALTQALKLAIVALVLLLAWKRRRTEPMGIFTTLGVSWAVFFVLAPGFGVQYLIWLAPCVLVDSERWYALLTVASSIALFAFYNALCGGLPWDTGFLVNESVAKWAPWLVLPWTALAAYLMRSLQLEWASAHSFSGQTEMPDLPQEA